MLLLLACERAKKPDMCQTDQDCGPGLSCRNGKCVSIPDAGGGVDAGPPEDEHMEFQPPVGSENYVFVVNTTLGTVAKIDPGALSNIEAPSPVMTVPPFTINMFLLPCLL